MTCRIVFARGTNRVEVEGDSEFVAQHLADLLPHVLGDVAANATSAADGERATPDEPNEGMERQSLRSFILAKAPRNAYDAIACVLFFTRAALAKPELTGDEIRAFLIQGKQRPPTVMAQALADAKRRYGYVEPGTRKGYWRLSQGGEVRVELELSGDKLDD